MSIGGDRRQLDAIGNVEIDSQCRSQRFNFGTGVVSASAGIEAQAYADPRIANRAERNGLDGSRQRRGAAHGADLRARDARGQRDGHVRHD